jgi:hypothetical protein
LQLAALKKAGRKQVFKYNGLSGATVKRPALLRCLKKLETGDNCPHRNNLSTLKDGGLSAFSVSLLLNIEISAFRDGVAH